MQQPSIAPRRALAGQRLRTARQAAGLSAAELARRIGRDRTYISHLEAGRATGGLDTFRSIARELGVSLDALVGEDVP
jgi:transcriptional regulator with XRE-family HTH domain